MFKFGVNNHHIASGDIIFQRILVESVSCLQYRSNEASLKEQQIKLMSKAVFGKTMEHVNQMVD